MYYEVMHFYLGLEFVECINWKVPDNSLSEWGSDFGDILREPRFYEKVD